MKKSGLLAALLLTSTTVAAQGQWGAGIGYPYGGAIGAQYSIKQGKDIFFGAVGLVGIAAGYQRVLDTAQQHSIGVVFGGEALSSDKGFIAAQYNYYLAGAGREGWVVGLTAGQRKEDDKHGSDTLLGFHAGYRF